MRKETKYQLLVSIIILSITAKISAQTSQSQLLGDPPFRAVYHRVLDYYTHAINVSLVAFSANGGRIFFSGKNADSDLVLYTLDADGSNMNSIPVPSAVNGVDAVAIDNSGNRAFFLESGNDYIYKVEGGAAVQILFRSEYPGIGNIVKIEATADGNYVYFDDGDDIWRLRNSGGAPELVIDDLAIQREEGKAKSIGDFAISDNGNVIGFIVNSYYDVDNHLRTKNEVFVYRNGNVQQLTNDPENVYKEHLGISGDGSTIVYEAASSVDKWFSIKSDKTIKCELDGLSSNSNIVSLSYDGSKVLLKGTEKSRLVDSDGTGGIALFPNWDVNTIALSLYDNASISNDGRRICFRFQLRTFPSYYALYVGYLYPDNTISGTPMIQNISFDPASMPTDNPEINMAIFSQISDPNGLADIDEVSVDGLINGILITNDRTKVPVFFKSNPRDDGNSPDMTAADGIFSMYGAPGDNIKETPYMTVRVGVKDLSGNVAVQDKLLKIGGTTAVIDNESAIPEFGLYQNFPNPFNSNTCILFTVKQTSHVVLKIFDLLGKEVTTLVNREHSPGQYQGEFNGQQLGSGQYFYQIQMGDFRETRRFVLLK